MTSRTARLNIIAQSLENQAHSDAVRLAQIVINQALVERTAQGIAPIEPAVLGALFAETPAAAWAALASLSDAQLVNQAIEYACWLEQQGLDKKWLAIYECWVARLADRAAEWADLMERAERGQLDGDIDEQLVVEEVEAAPAPQISAQARDKAAYRIAAGVAIQRVGDAFLVPSANTAGQVYRVEDGRCSCKAGQAGRSCWHVAAAAQEARADEAQEVETMLRPGIGRLESVSYAAVSGR